MKPKVIGILAGMGPKSTGYFIDLVINQCQKQYGAKYDEDFPHIIIYSLPTPFYIDRPINHTKLKKVVRTGLKKLESFGVDFIAIPCNTVHAYFVFLEESIKIPLLNIIDETLKSLDSKKSKITLLATPTTVDLGIYQKGIRKKGLDYFFKGEWQKTVNEVIKKIKSNEIQSASLQWNKLLESIRKEKVNTIIIGCTDLSILEKPKYFTFIDTTERLAEAVVRNYLIK